MKVIVAGELPFVEDVTALCVTAEHDTHAFLVEDFLGAIESGYLLDDLSDVEVVIELHNESAAAKHELLMALADAVPYNALILTSALATSATQAAAWVPRPERVVGFGLMPPIGSEGLVEIAPALQTAEPSINKAAEFWQSLNYEAIQVADGPGLVRGRIICCLINEAVSALMEGVAEAADIDQAMRLGTNYPFGPLEWGDMIGLDTVLGVMTGLYEAWGEDRYRPTPLLRRMVLAGKLGRKSGEGFYLYDG
jgi:3-hydroxybutyryl-CoA dehydrogenase